MSEVDERTIKLGMDYSELEEGAQESTSILDKLKQTLSFSDTEKSLASFGKSFLNHMSELSSGAEQTANQVSGFFEECWSNIKTQFERNIGNDLYNSLKSLVDSVTSAPISEGWSKYESSVESVQKILTNSSYTIEEVESYIDELAWYSDQTSYSLTDMTGALSTFVSAGLEGDQSVDQIMGIANWCATAGVNASQASGAFDMLSKAVSAGKMSLLQWNSLSKVYHMGTTKFYEVTEKAAIAAGSLKKNADGTYEALKDTGSWTDEHYESMSAVMQDTLKYGWFDSDIMDTVFKTFGSATTDIYEWFEETGTDTIEVQEAIEALGLTTEDFGLKAFYAAQQAKTWSDVVDAWKDVVSTSWSTTFQALFGNYEEAADFWTWFVDEVGEFFWTVPSAISEIATTWHDMKTEVFGDNQQVTRYEQFIQAIKNFISGFKALGGYFYDWMSETFGFFDENDFAKITSNLWAFSRKFYDFCTGTNLEGRAATWYGRLQGFFEGVGDAIEFVVDLLKTLWDVFKYFLSGGETWEDAYGFTRDDTFGRFAENVDVITKALYKFGEFLKDVKESADEYNFFDNLKEGLESFIDVLWKFGSIIGKGVLHFLGIDDVEGVWNTGQGNALVDGLDDLGGKIEDFFEKIDSMPTLEEWANDHLWKWMQSSDAIGSALGDWLYNAGDYLGDEETSWWLEDGGTMLNAIVEAYGGTVDGISGIVNNGTILDLLKNNDLFRDYVADLYGVENDYDSVVSAMKDTVIQSNELQGKYMYQGLKRSGQGYVEVLSSRLEEAAMGMDDGVVISPLDLLMARIDTWFNSLPSLWDLLFAAGSGFLDGTGIDWDGVSEDISQQIKDIFDDVKEDLANSKILDSLWEAMGVNLEGDTYEEALYDIGYSIGQIVPSVKSFIDVSWETFSTAVGTFKQGLKDLWEAIKTYLPEDWVTNLEELVGYDGSGNGAEGNNKIKNFIDTLSDIMEGFGQAIGLFGKAFHDASGSDAKSLQEDYDTAYELFGSFGGIIVFMGELMNAAVAFIGPFIQFLTGSFQEMLDAIDSVSNGDETWLQAASDAFIGIFENVTDFFSSIWNILKTFFTNSGFSGQSAESVTEQVGTVCSAYTSVSSAISPYVSSLSYSVDSGGVATGTSSTMSAMEAIATAWSNIKTYAGAAGGMAKQTVVGTVTLICETVGDCCVVVIEQLGRIYNAFVGSGLMGAVVSGTAIWGIITAVNAFSAMCGAVKKMATSFNIGLSGLTDIGTGVKKMGQAQLIEAYTGGIKDIIFAVVGLAAVCFILSLVPTDDLMTGATVMILLGGVLAILFAAYAYLMKTLSAAKATAAAASAPQGWNFTWNKGGDTITNNVQLFTASLQEAAGEFLRQKGKAEVLKAQGKLILEVVIAIGLVIAIIIGAALALKAMIDNGYTGYLAMAAAAVALLTLFIVLFMAAMVDFIEKCSDGKWKNMLGQAAVLTAMGALLITVVAVIVVIIGVILLAALAIREIIMGPNGLDGYGTAGLVAGVILVGVIMALIAAFFWAINSFGLKGVTNKNATGKLEVLGGMAAVILSLGIVIGLIVAGVVLIGLLIAADMSSFLLGAAVLAIFLIIVGVIVGVIAEFGKSGTKAKASYIAQLGILLLELAVVILAIAVAAAIISKCDFSTVNWEGFVGVALFLVVIPALLVLLAGIAVSTKKVKANDLKMIAIIVLAVAGFALILAAAMRMIAGIDWQSIDTDKVFGMMLIMALIPALVVAFAGIVQLAGGALGSVALGVMAALLISFAAAMIGVGLAVFFLAEALNVIAGIDTAGLNANLDSIAEHIENIGFSIGIAIFAIGKFGAEGLATLTPLLEPIIKMIEDIFIAVVIACAVIAAALAACGEDVGGFVDSFVEAFRALINGVDACLPDIQNLLSDLIIAFADTVIDATPAIGEALETIVETLTHSLLKGVFGVFPDLIEWLDKSMDEANLGDSGAYELEVAVGTEWVYDEDGNISDVMDWEKKQQKLYFDSQEELNNFKSSHQYWNGPSGSAMLTEDEYNRYVKQYSLQNWQNRQDRNQSSSDEALSEVQEGVDEFVDNATEVATSGASKLADGIVSAGQGAIDKIQEATAGAFSGSDEDGEESGTKWYTGLFTRAGLGEYLNSDGSINYDKAYTDVADKLGASTSGQSILSLFTSSFTTGEGETMNLETAWNLISNGETITMSDGTTISSTDDITSYLANASGIDMTQLSTSMNIQMNDDGTYTYNGTTYSSMQDVLSAMMGGTSLDTDTTTTVDVDYNMSADSVEEEASTLQGYVPLFQSVGQQLANSLVSGWQSEYENAKAAGEWLGIKLSVGIQSKYDLCYHNGLFTVKGFIDAINQMLPTMYQKGCEMAQQVNDGYANTIDEHSPSRVFFAHGINTALGAILGLEAEENNLYDAGASAAASVSGGFQDTMGIKSTITPVMDTSNIQNGASSIASMFTNATGMNAQYTANIRSSGVSTKALITNGFSDLNRSFGNMLTSNNGISGKFDELTSAVKNMDVTLDSSLLVGGITDKMDMSLARAYKRRSRG